MSYTEAKECKHFWNPAECTQSGMHALACSMRPGEPCYIEITKEGTVICLAKEKKGE